MCTNTIPQIVTSYQFDVCDILQLYDMGFQNRLLHLVNTENGIREFNVANIEKSINLAFKYIKSRSKATHIGNEIEYLGYALPHRTDYTLIECVTKNQGPHWIIGDEHRIRVWDPDPHLEAEETDHCLRFRIDVE